MAPVEKFSIVLDSDKTIYHPGDEVKGRVFVHLNAEASIKRVSVRFRGRGSVNYHESYKTHCSLTQTHFDYESILFPTEDQEGTLVIFSPGEYWFPFSFTLPNFRLPTSYYDRTASVVYLLEAFMKKPTGIAVERISVREPVKLDIKKIELNLTKHNLQFICCWGNRGGNVNVHGKINKTGFYLGEVIQAKFYVENHSIRHVTFTEMDLVQTVLKRYREGRDVVDIKFKSVSAIEGSGVPAQTEADIEGLSLTIPDSIPPSTTFEESIVRVLYTVILTAHVKGRCNNACRVEFPIAIGYMPEEFDWSRIEPLKTHCPVTVGKVYQGNI